MNDGILIRLSRAQVRQLVGRGYTYFLTLDDRIIRLNSSEINMDENDLQRFHESERTRLNGHEQEA